MISASRANALGTVRHTPRSVAVRAEFEKRVSVAVEKVAARTIALRKILERLQFARVAVPFLAQVIWAVGAVVASPLISALTFAAREGVAGHCCCAALGAVEHRAALVAIRVVLVARKALAARFVVVLGRVAELAVLSVPRRVAVARATGGGVALDSVGAVAAVPVNATVLVTKRPPAAKTGAARRAVAGRVVLLGAQAAVPALPLRRTLADARTRT
jgi:hypothetical protein